MCDPRATDQLGPSLVVNMPLYDPYSEVVVRCDPHTESEVVKRCDPHTLSEVVKRCDLHTHSEVVKMCDRHSEAVQRCDHC